MSTPANAGFTLARRLVVVAALLVLFWLSVSTVLDKSLTTDEPVHLTRAALLQQSADFSLQEGHMPLSHWLIGALFGTEPDLPRIRELETWSTGDRLVIADEFLWQHGINVDRLSFLGRMSIIWVTLLMGANVGLWTTAVARDGTRRTGGGENAVLAALAVIMALFAFYSNIIAAATVATTDLVITALYFATTSAWWFYWQRPRWSLWLITGLLLGALLASKLTGFLLIPVLLPLAYVYPGKSRDWWRPGLIWLGLLPVAALALWAIYALSVGDWLGLTVPGPAYLQSWQTVFSHVESGHQAFFLGELSHEGWWLYFPVTFLIKTPIIWLVLAAAGLVMVVLRRASWQVAAFTLLPCAVLMAAAVASHLNIGYRHILPMAPFLLVFIGSALPALWSRRVVRWAIGASVALTAVVSLWIHPDHLAAFNLVVGGPAQGYRYLGDSNLDWGQDLRNLAEYIDASPVPVAWSVSGSADPAYYGLTSPPLIDADGAVRPDFSPANPAPGRYALSAAQVQGVMAESDLFDWFRRRAPDDSVGYSVLIYHVTAPAPGAWTVHCMDPVPVLADEAAERLLGVAGGDIRHVYADCEQTNVFPGGGPGWTIVRGLVDEDDVVYKHRATDDVADYTVRHTTVANLTNDWQTAAQTTTGAPAPLPQMIGSTAELVGYRVDGGAWSTLWRVLAATGEPLSVQAHLLDSGGAVVSVADSLGYGSSQWQPGDLFVQRFDFGEASGAFLETGLYNYQTLEPLEPLLRLPINGVP